MRKAAATGALVALIVGTSGAEGQRPDFGVGVTGGIFFGSQLVEHRFSSEGQELSQRVDLTEVGILSAHAEWYATRHLALRVHGSWGAGRLSPVTSMAGDGAVDADAFDSGFGAVRMAAYDAGVSFWPLEPRSAGFAPFVTLGYGVVRYDFQSEGGAERFFLADGLRASSGLLLGAGADMLVWEGVTLRLEAMNHVGDAPLRPGDFAIPGTFTAASSSRFGDGISNVRLVLGAHVYFPFVSGSLLPE